MTILSSSGVDEDLVYSREHAEMMCIREVNNLLKHAHGNGYSNIVNLKRLAEKRARPYRLAIVSNI